MKFGKLTFSAMIKYFFYSNFSYLSQITVNRTIHAFHLRVTSIVRSLRPAGPLVLKVGLYV